MRLGVCGRGGGGGRGLITAVQPQQIHARKQVLQRKTELRAANLQQHHLIIAEMETLAFHNYYYSQVVQQADTHTQTHTPH